MGSKVRKMLGMVLVVSMIVSCFTGFGKEEAKATQPPVPYLDYNETKRIFEVKSCTAYDTITESTTEFNGSEGGSWYVAQGTVTVSDRITVFGTVNLILKDNCVFTASKGIKVATGNAFNIYGQGTINGANTTAGELRATGVEWEAGIGGRTSESVGCITINGGIVTASGGTGGVGIGVGNGSGGSITINEGTVTARGGEYGAGIGVGNGPGGSITINEGTVMATGGIWGAGIGGGNGGSGGSITINEGTITARGGTGGAGIGGGENGSGGSITINEGTITAIGGANGAGIGGGNGGSGGNISIIGGSVYATGGTWGAGIGGGNGGSGGSITINKGTITASGGTGGAGIGGGYDKAAGSITINEGTVTATGGNNGAGIGGGNGGQGGNISIYGGSVYATGGTRGAGIGGGINGAGGFITINEGTVTAIGGNYGAGIGGGSEGSGGSITINKGTVTATGGDNGAGIGGGQSSQGGRIEINGGTATATGGDNGAGIGGGFNGAGGSITINKGTVTATGGIGGAGIGGGKNGSGGGNISVYGGSVYASGGDSGCGIGKGGGSFGVGLYSLGTGMKGFSSSSEDSDYDGLYYSFRDTSKYVIAYKERSGLLTASGSAITAKYVDGTGNKQSIDLTINAPSEIVYGNDDSAKATLVSADNFNNALGKTGDEEKVSASLIKYYGANGQLINAAPTAKGNYTAKITVDGVTAAVGYEITKEDPVITAPVATSPEYTGDEQNLITAGLSTGGTLKYSLSENGTFSADIPTATSVGTYTVFYMVEGDNDYKSSIKYSVSAGISKASLNLSLTQDGWEKGNTAPDPVLSGNKGSGSVTYAYKKQSDNDNAYVDNAVPTEPGEYVVRATVSETQNYFGGTATAEFTITDPEPNPAPVTVYQPSYYPEESKPVEKKDDGRTTTTEVKNSDGTISEISVTKLADGSITRETVRDKDGKFVEYKYEYTWTKKNGTTVVQTFNEKADGSKKETSITTTKSGTVSTRVKELTADGTLISTEGKSYADGRTSLKEATTGTDGVTKVVTEKTDAAGNGVKAEYTSVIDDAEAKSDTKISLTAVEVIGTTFKLPAEIWVNEQYFVVTEIGMGALKNNKAVTKLTIGENVTRIGSSAFRNMTNLKSITINASSLESIGKNAFKGVGDKKRVTITIKGVTEEEFEKICKMIRKAGIGKKAVFVIG